MQAAEVSHSQPATGPPDCGALEAPAAALTMPTTDAPEQREPQAAGSPAAPQSPGMLCTTMS